MQKTKVAIIVNRFYPEVGGAETNLYFQANAMAKDCDVTIFTPRRLADTAACESLNGYKICRLFDVLNLRKNFPNLKTDTLMPSVFFKILFGKYDVVMAFPSLNKNNMLALLAAKLRKIPFILCSFDLLDYAKILEKTGEISDDIIKNFKIGSMRAKLLAMCSHIFAISNREIDFYKKYNKSVSYSPVPVNIAEYKSESQIDVREKFAIGEGDMLYLCLGRVSKIKGQDIALKAFAEIADGIPSAKLAIVGRLDYEPEFVKGMQDFAKERKISDRVIFTGVLERPEVVAFLEQSNVHIIPVRFMNSGAVVVETWAATTPVIQSSAVDPNYVSEGENGWLFASTNVEELAQKMRAAYAKKSELKQMGENGKRYVLENLTYQNLMDIYYKTIARFIKK